MPSIQWLRWHLRWHLAYCCDCCNRNTWLHSYNGLHLLKSSIFSKISYSYSVIAQELISSPDSVLIDETLWFDETRLGFERNIPSPGFFCLPGLSVCFLPSGVFCEKSGKLSLTSDIRSDFFPYCFWLNLCGKEGKELSTALWQWATVSLYCLW